MQNKPVLGVSACLLGQPVRYDGGHKRDRYIVETLGRYFEFVAVCPEMVIGLGVPRPPIRLLGPADNTRVVGVEDDKLDVTQALADTASATLQDNPNFAGYVLKSRSPSCGMEGVKRYAGPDSDAVRDGVGQFAKALMETRPELPVEEEGRLQNPVLRENFIERVFVFRRWLDLIEVGLTKARLLDFHTAHKYALLAHSQETYRELGRLLSDLSRTNCQEILQEYIRRLMNVFRQSSSRQANANVLQHIQGYLDDEVDSDDRQELAKMIDQYRTGQCPLSVPLTLLRHHFRRYPNDYIARQTYMQSCPAELILRNFT